MKYDNKLFDSLKYASALTHPILHMHHYIDEVPKSVGRAEIIRRSKSQKRHLSHLEP